jgi:hypothetical protein
MTRVSGGYSINNDWLKAIITSTKNTRFLHGNLQIEIETIKPGLPNLLPLFSCGITISSSLNITRDIHITRFTNLGQQEQDFGVAYYLGHTRTFIW